MNSSYPNVGNQEYEALFFSFFFLFYFNLNNNNNDDDEHNYEFLSLQPKLTESKGKNLFGD